MGNEQNKVVDNLLKIVNEGYQSILEVKDNYLRTQLKEYGISITELEKDPQRRFKRFSVEYNKTHEFYYYDDGTEAGLLWATFPRYVPKMNDPSFNLIPSYNKRVL